MKHALLLLLFFARSFCSAQNLVPNPSFEDTVSCPYGADKLNQARYWFSALNSCDYYNPCAAIDNPAVSVPHNWGGYQTALDGDAYAGIVLYAILPPPAIDYREIMSVPLIQPLTIGVKYFVSAYISSGYSDICQCFANNFGFRFSNVAYHPPGSHAPVDNFSHVHSTTIIEDTTNWVWMGESFVADSAYPYLMVGNFYDDANTDTADCIDLPNYGRVSYYYVDKVCVSTDSLENLPTGIIKTKSGTRVYPNPVNDALHIEGFSSITECCLTDCFGNLIFQDVLHPPNAIVNTAIYSNGLYTLQLNKTYFFKLIIHH
jgi:hypothetical protein